MSHTMPIEQAASKLAELVGALLPGDEIVLTDRNRPVARILPSEPTRARRQPGNCRGMLVIEREDGRHLADFGDYMP